LGYHHENKVLMERGLEVVEHTEEVTKFSGIHQLFKALCEELCGKDMRNVGLTKGKYTLS
jgi:hypothetical protein